MGTSLGYGQGMEYQFFDTPQPSQPMARLRQERLQQLREERLRRQQRRIQGDVTTAIPRKPPPRQSITSWCGPGDRVAQPYRDVSDRFAAIAVFTGSCHPL